MQKELPLNIKTVPGGGVGAGLPALSTAHPIHPNICSFSYSSGDGVLVCAPQFKFGIVGMSLCPLFVSLDGWLVGNSEIWEYRAEFGTTATTIRSTYKEIVPLFGVYCPACCVAALEVY